MYRWLTREGYEVIQAGNLQDALIKTSERSFDLYVSDGSFPLVPLGRENINAGEEFYNSLKRSRADRFNFVFISSDDSLADLAEQEGIKFMDKNAICMREFLAYLGSLI